MGLPPAWWWSVPVAIPSWSGCAAPVKLAAYVMAHFAPGRPGVVDTVAWLVRLRRSCDVSMERPMRINAINPRILSHPSVSNYGSGVAQLDVELLCLPVDPLLRTAVRCVAEGQWGIQSVLLSCTLSVCVFFVV